MTTMLSFNQCNLPRLTRALQRIPAAVLISMLTGGCTPNQLTRTAEQPPDPQSEGRPESRSDTRQSVWQVTGSLVIHVGKTGRLARLGHNHLIASEELHGEAWLTKASELQAEVRVAAADLRVDDPTLRASYRESVDTYNSTPSAKNIADTRDNMLGPRVLDVANHPFIRVSITAPAFDFDEEFRQAPNGVIDATLEIEIRGNRSKILTELKWQRLSEAQIQWQSHFETTHTALQLTPFSALGGALAVADLLKLEVSGTLDQTIRRSGTIQTARTRVRQD